MSQEEHKEFTRVVAERQKGRRIDHYLISAGIGLSRSLTQKLINTGKVLVNKSAVKSSYRVKTGDEIEVHFVVQSAPQMQPEDIPLDIVHEDSEIIVVNKQKGIVVHPARGNFQHTMVNALLHHVGELPTLGDRIRPGVLHRLDKDTTGLIMFAKTDSALTFLSRAIERREVRKKYEVVCWEYPGLPEGVIEAPIGRSGLDRKKMTVTPLSSKVATTKFTVQQRFRIATHLSVVLITGRTHQIRVHFKHIGCPIVGDKDYGGRSPGIIRKSEELPVFKGVLGLIDRQALHAAELDFVHPASKRRMHLKASLPQDMQTVLAYLREYSLR